MTLGRKVDGFLRKSKSGKKSCMGGGEYWGPGLSTANKGKQGTRMDRFNTVEVHRKGSGHCVSCYDRRGARKRSSCKVKSEFAGKAIDLLDNVNISVRGQIIIFLYVLWASKGTQR